MALLFSLLYTASLAHDTLVFRQTVPFLYQQNQWRLNPTNVQADNFAILDELENYRNAEGLFHFILRYPQDAEGVFYEWTQESNPTTDLIHNYTAIHEPYTGQNWGGLEPSFDALMDGSVGHGHWFYAIGTNRLWQNGIPGYAKSDSDVLYPQQVVELYTVNSVFVATNEPTFKRTGEPVETTSEPSQATSEPTTTTSEPTPEPTLVTMEPTVATLEPSPEPTMVTLEPTLTTLEPTPEPTLVTNEPTVTQTEEPTGITLEPTVVTAEPTLVTNEPTMSSMEPTTEQPTSATLEPTTLVTSSEPTAPEPTTLPSYINYVVISDLENDWNGVVDVVEDTHDDFYTKHGDAGYMLLGSAVLVLCAMCCCSRWLCSSKSKIVQADTKVQVIIDAKTLEHGLQGTKTKNTPLAKTATKSPALTDASSMTDYDSITLQLYVTQPEGIETMEPVE